MSDLLKCAAAAALVFLVVVLARQTIAPEIYFLLLSAAVFRFLGPEPFRIAASLAALSLITEVHSVSAFHTQLAMLVNFSLGVAVIWLSFMMRRNRPSVVSDPGKRVDDYGKDASLRLVIDTIPALVWCATPDGEPAFINKRMAEFIGVSEREFVRPMSKTGELSEAATSSWQPLLHPDDYEAAKVVWMEALATGRSYRSIHRLRRADGMYRWFHSMGEAIKDDEGNIYCWYGINIDVDDARRNEEYLAEAREKLSRTMQLAAIAELSASIAHEINQPLAAILANSQASKHWMAADPPNLQRLNVSVDRIIRDAKATSAIVARVRALFKQASPEKELLDVNGVIQEVLRLVRDQIRRRRIQVHTSLHLGLPHVLGDRIQVQQLLMNLVLNAIDAMSTESVHLPRLSLTSRLASKDLIEVQVRDAGCGLADKEQIFEPFYTTKPHGMGMGLAICRTIAEQHGGSLDAQANDDRGTTFTFSIPRGWSTAEAKPAEHRCGFSGIVNEVPRMPNVYEQVQARPCY
jgi:PAS domain S-box-containing protein